MKYLLSFIIFATLSSSAFAQEVAPQNFASPTSQIAILQWEKQAIEAIAMATATAKEKSDQQSSARIQALEGTIKAIDEEQDAEQDFLEGITCQCLCGSEEESGGLLNQDALDRYRHKTEPPK